MEPQTQMLLVDDHLGGSGSLLDTNGGFCCLIPSVAAVVATLPSLKLTLMQNNCVFVGDLN